MICRPIRVGMIFYLIILLVTFISACTLIPTTTIQSPETSVPIMRPSGTPILTDTSIITDESTLPAPTQTHIHPTRTEPPGCLKPPDNYERLIVNGHTINRRTYTMLLHAADLYQGSIDITGAAITQGSYTTGEPASFNTHAGGGAVDLSVLEPGTFTVLENEIEPLIEALRQAGFAAWLRDFNDLYPGSPIHIHAIAIGDRELSLAAREQLAGPHGYFWGYNGLPVDEGIPERDPHGGPIICNWMIIDGYPNKTATPAKVD